MTKDFLKSKYENVKTDVLILYDVFQTQTLATENLNFYLTFFNAIFIIQPIEKIHNAKKFKVYDNI